MGPRIARGAPGAAPPLAGSRPGPLSQSLVMEPTFQHILRVLNTNINGRERVYIALTSIRGVGRRFADLICKKAEVDRTKRCAGSPAARARGAHSPLRFPRSPGRVLPRRAALVS